MTEITLAPLTADDREQFIRDNQEAFNYGALEEFGLRDGFRPVSFLLEALDEDSET